MSALSLRFCLALALFSSGSFGQQQTFGVGGPLSEFSTLSEAMDSLPDILPYNARILVEIGPDGISESGLFIDGEQYTALGSELVIEAAPSTMDGAGQTEITYYVGEEIEYRVDAAENVTSIFNFGANGRQVNSGSQAEAPKEYFLQDHLGSLITTVSDAGVANGPLIGYSAYGRQQLVAASTSAPLTRTFTGKEYDLLDESDLESPGLYHFGTRTYDPDIAMWISPDPARQFNTPYAFSSNPANSTDKDGQMVDAIWDAASLTMGVASLVSNVMKGEVGAAAIDGVGVVFDAAALLVPVVPGGAGAGIKAVRLRRAAKAAEEGIEGASHLLPFTARNFRQNLGKLTGSIPADAQAHHIFPQKFIKQFQGKIDIHDPKFGAWWASGPHNKAAAAYNQAWEKFLESNPSKSQILQFGRDISAKYGLKINF